MKIRRIEVQGFKSFADRTVFEFGPGITAIVGPNGCGKSNVVDALKWVLGDMSPRSLRGKKMEDVIFAGSRTRKPVGMSEVTLVLDNEDGLLPTEHSEVSITRRLHRTGESEYRINGQAARLKDIRELFLDTGLGTEGNSIMEQGQIDALLAANPHDRRGIFEEAAGVSRYKQRRKEAAQRLNRTHENLERLRDVLELEEKRFRSLKTQASKARRYQAAREELAKKRVLRAVVRYRSIAEERGGLQGRMSGLLEREAQAAEELTSLDQAVQTAEQGRDAAREEAHALEAKIAEAAAEARAAQDRASYAAQSISELTERVEAATRQAEAARQRVLGIQSEVEALEAEADGLDGQAGRQQALVEEAEAELSRLETEAARIRDAHEGVKRDALSALGRLGEVRNEEAERRAEIRQADERMERLTTQRGELQVRAERIGGEARELVALTASLEERTREHAAEIERQESRRAELLTAADTAARRREAAGEERATKASRLEVLQRLAAAREGVDAGARRIMDAVADRSTEPVNEGSSLECRDGVIGLLADFLAPTPEAAAKLDRLLGHAAGALVVRSKSDALRWIDWLKAQDVSERARFLCLDLVRPAGADALASRGVAPGALGCDPRLEAVVGSVVAGTVLVPDLAAGIQEYLERGVNAVTPSGERVTASGALLAGHDRNSMGLVERAAEMRALGAEVQRLEADVETARAEASTAEASVREVEETLRRLRIELADRIEDKSRRGEALARVEKERSHVSQSIEVLESELRELSALAEDSRKAMTDVTARVEALESERESLEEQAEEAARGYVAVDASRKTASERRMEVKLAFADARSRAATARGRVERAHDEIRELEARAQELGREAQALTERIGRTEVEVTEAKAVVKAREAERGQAGDVLLKARERLAAMEQEALGATERRRSVLEVHGKLRDELEKFRLKDSELRVRIESLIEQVEQEHELDLAEVSTEAEATEEIDLAAMDEEVENLRRRLASLGNVNLNAINELAEAEEHLGFLQGQEQDLLNGKSDLEKAIKELDEVSTLRFAETFEKIRVHFRETFRRLFGGGRAEIVLEDASNLLESGIEVIARPPGKEQRTISLLSGGERTLTAVALLFAVFKAKPSPFSVLDEVDAALDEANVRRLCGLIQEYTDRSQFVIVTHAKSTMEMADVLYGVTMEEPGVSKRVAVKLTEFPEELQAAASA